MKVFIYAGSYDQFKVAAYRLGLESSAVYLSEPDQLRGLYHPKVYKYGTFFMNHQHEIIELMLRHNYADVHVITERDMCKANGDG